MLGERVSEGGGSNAEGPVSPTPMLGPGERGEEVGVGRCKVAGLSVSVQKVSEAGCSFVVDGFVSDEENFELNSEGLERKDDLS